MRWATWNGLGFVPQLGEKRKRRTFFCTNKLVTGFTSDTRGGWSSDEKIGFSGGARPDSLKKLPSLPRRGFSWILGSFVPPLAPLCKRGEFFGAFWLNGSGGEDLHN